MKELSIGGIIMLKNLSGEKEEIVEPMVVNKVSHNTRNSSQVLGFYYFYNFFVKLLFTFSNTTYSS